MSASPPSDAGAPPRLKIRSTKDLVDALLGPDLGVRLSVLRAIAADPHAAMAYGPHEGRDLIAWLIELAGGTPESALRSAYVCAIAAYDDPRMIAFCREEFPRTRDAQTAALMADRLRRVPVEELRSQLEPIVMALDSVVHARLAANLLAGHSALESPAAVRVALLSDRDEAVAPPLDDNAGSAWLAELSGALGQRARGALESQGATACEALLSRWDDLAPACRPWLLEWGARAAPEAVVGRLRRLLTEGVEGDLLVGALQCVASLGAHADALRPLVDRFVRDPAPKVRAAAIRGGGRGDWAEAVWTEPEPGVRVAMTERIALEGGSAATEVLARLLADEDWRVRARATECLIGLGEAALGPAREALERPQAAARAAAAQVLIGLGHERWVEDRLTR